jgi:hypothetical protein
MAVAAIRMQLAQISDLFRYILIWQDFHKTPLNEA